jgi:SAM-dependent methyltransferase
MAANNKELLKKASREMTQKDIKDKFGDGPFNLNLGCGSDLKKKHINIDVLDTADLQLDLEIGKLPFPKNSCESVFAAHIFEHLHNFAKIVNECHRILKPNKILQVHVPCYPAAECFHDPTHVRVFTDKTFQYFLNGSFLGKHCGESYGFTQWRKVEQHRINGWELVVRLTK